MQSASKGQSRAAGLPPAMASRFRSLVHRLQTFPFDCPCSDTCTSFFCVLLRSHPDSFWRPIPLFAALVSSRRNGISGLRLSGPGRIVIGKDRYCCAQSIQTSTSGDNVERRGSITSYRCVHDDMIVLFSQRRVAEFYQLSVPCNTYFTSSPLIIQLVATQRNIRPGTSSERRITRYYWAFLQFDKVVSSKLHTR